MKTLQDLRQQLVEDDRSDRLRFDQLVRAGLMDRTQLTRLHRILSKLEIPGASFNTQDRSVIIELLDHLVSLVTQNTQLFQKTRQAVRADALQEDVAWVIPTVLLLRRKAIRMFPDGTRLALYYNDKLDKYFSIPIRSKEFAGHDDPITSSESVIINEDAISHLHHIKNFSTSQPLHHDNGEKTKVDPTTAHALLTVHNALSPEHQKTYAGMISHSKQKFHKAVDFAWKHVS